MIRGSIEEGREAQVDEIDRDCMYNALKVNPTERSRDH
jgi:hypothetical protein